MYDRKFKQYYNRFLTAGSIGLVTFCSIGSTNDRVAATTVNNPGGYQEIEFMTDSKIKFGDASPGLGEDYSLQTETFIIKTATAGSSVAVTTKASTNQETSYLSPDNLVVTDSLGFKIALTCVRDNTFTIYVESVSNPHALSHVEFDFGSQRNVTSYQVSRTSGLLAPPQTLCNSATIAPAPD